MWTWKIDAKDAKVHFGNFKPVKAEEGRYEDYYGNMELHYWYMFDNGYGASVANRHVPFNNPFGHQVFEVAVIDSSYSICRDTPITDGVVGNLKKDEVTEILKKIEALPPRKEIKAEN